MNGTDILWQLVHPLAEGFWLALDLLFGVLFWLGVGFAPMRWRNLALIARWVAIPYLGLIAGGVSPRLMGLVGVNWRDSLTLGVGLIAVAVGLLLFVRASTASITNAAEVNPSTETPLATRNGWAEQIFGLWASGAEEFHWCFLRAAFLSIFVIVSGDNANANYGAIWVAALVALPEALLAAPPGSPRPFKVVALLSTTILFLVVRNFWLCWALHASIMFFAGSMRWQAEQNRY